MLCYVHIPKTGGTTTNYMLGSSLGASFLVPEPWVDARRVISPADLLLLKKWMPWVKHISSHYIRAYSGLERVQPDIIFFTIMREPVARYISHYYHLKDKSFRVSNFYEFMSNKAWRNIQIKYIAGCEDVEKAKQLLRENFVYVGLLERIDETLVMMRKMMADIPLDVRYGPAKNVANRRRKEQEIWERWDEYEAQVTANNWADIELYHFVKEELYPSQQKQYGPTLANDLALFKAQNAVAPAKFLWQYIGSRLYYKLLLNYYRKHAIKSIKIDNGSLHQEYEFFCEGVFY